MSYNATSIFLFVSFLHLLKKGFFFFFFFFFKVQHSQVRGHKRVAVFGKKSRP